MILFNLYELKKDETEETNNDFKMRERKKEISRKIERDILLMNGNWMSHYTHIVSPLPVAAMQLFYLLQIIGEGNYVTSKWKKMKKSRAETATAIKAVKTSTKQNMVEGVFVR